MFYSSEIKIILTLSIFLIYIFTVVLPFQSGFNFHRYINSNPIKIGIWVLFRFSLLLPLLLIQIF
jgi:hypothetical protein